MKMISWESQVEELEDIFHGRVRTGANVKCAI